eukprot:4535078-Heterocapsa_arctica.AAC.1
MPQAYINNAPLQGRLGCRRLISMYRDVSVWVWVEGPRARQEVEGHGPGERPRDLRRREGVGVV